MRTQTPWRKFNGRVKLSLTIKPESSSMRLRRFDVHSRAPTLTHSPTSSADLTALSREQAAAAFDSYDAPQAWLNDKARVAILSPPGFVVSASPAMLALFGVKDCEALEARLVRGEGPSARRLRHLAATLPIGGPPRLEQIRVVVERRPAGVNLRCVRIGGQAGATWLLASAPALGAASNEPLPPPDDCEAVQPEDPATQDLAGTPPPDLRRCVAEFALPLDARRGGPLWRGPSRARRRGWGERAPSRRILSRPFSTAPGWLAATNWPACLGIGKPSPASRSSGRFRELRGAG